jgi:hypothetical protein
MRMKMSHHLYMVALFRDGWIKLVAILSSRISSLPPISMSFISMIDYMLIYTHDYYVLNLSLLYFIIKHRGKHFDEMMSRWLHWLYDFT